MNFQKYENYSNLIYISMIGNVITLTAELVFFIMIFSEHATEFVDLITSVIKRMAPFFVFLVIAVMSFGLVFNIAG